MQGFEDIRSNVWPELCIKIAKRAKEHSREFELYILGTDLPAEDKRKTIEAERQYRESCDEDIEKWKERLMKLKED